MKLGPSFRNYDGVSTKFWEENVCSWKPFDQESCDGFVIRQLKRGEEAEVANVWAQGFPELFRGTYGFVLEPKGYEIFFGDEWRMFVFERNKKLVGARILRMDQSNLSVEFVLVTVLPSCRSLGIAKRTAQITDKYVNECGIELATVSVARFHTATLGIFKGLGFSSVGVIPGAIRANVDGIRYRRDSVELLYKLYRDAARLVPPLEPEKGE